MVKKVFKEIIITLLILTIMLLLLGILLYDNITINKIIPEIAKYETSTNIKNEISENSNTGFQNEILTYEVTESDLKLYKNQNIYTPGKENPFVKDSTGSLNVNTYTNSNSNSGINNVLYSNKTQKTK